MSVEYITPSEAARLLRVNERTVRRWIREGKLKARRFGRLLRIPKSDLEAQLPAQWASEEAFKKDWDNSVDADYDKSQERIAKQRQILDLFGKIDYDPGYDYKAERRKR